MGIVGVEFEHVKGPLILLLVVRCLLIIEPERENSPLEKLTRSFSNLDARVTAWLIVDC